MEVETLRPGHRSVTLLAVGVVFTEHQPLRSRSVLHHELNHFLTLCGLQRSAKHSLRLLAQLPDTFRLRENLNRLLSLLLSRCLQVLRLAVSELELRTILRNHQVTTSHTQSTRLLSVAQRKNISARLLLRHRVEQHALEVRLLHLLGDLLLGIPLLPLLDQLGGLLAREEDIVATRIVTLGRQLRVVFLIIDIKSETGIDNQLSLTRYPSSLSYNSTFLRSLGTKENNDALTVLRELQTIRSHDDGLVVNSVNGSLQLDKVM